MRKRILPFIAAVLLALVLALTLVGCDNDGGANKAKPDNISRMTDTFLTGESEDFNVVVETGRRETPFIADGAVKNVKSFTEIMVTPLKQNTFTEIKFELTSGSSTLTGTIEQIKTGGFATEINLGFVPTAVKLTAGDKTADITLVDVLVGAKKGSEIVDIAKTEFADRIKAEAGSGALKREIYVKVISGDRENFYYYISFIGAGVDYWALLVNPADGKIVAKR